MGQTAVPRSPRRRLKRYSATPWCEPDARYGPCPCLARAPDNDAGARTTLTKGMHVTVLPDLTRMSPALLAVIVATAIMFAVAVGFLGAAARLRRANSRKAALWTRLETKLDAVVASIVHGSADAEVLHSRIKPAEHVVLLDYLYKVATQEKRPARRQLYMNLARPYLGELEKRARSGDVWQRARAIRTLAELAGRDAGETILAALDAPEPHVAMTAARAYAQVRLGRVDALLARLPRYHNWDRRLLRSVLVSFGPEAAPALADTFADLTLDPYSRAVCADALAELEYRSAGDVALRVLVEEDNIDLVAASLRLLRAPAAAGQRHVVRQLCQAEDEVVRGQAVSCLARIGDDADLVDFVKPALLDESPWVARAAAQGLTERTGEPWSPPVDATRIDERWSPQADDRVATEAPVSPAVPARAVSPAPFATSGAHTNGGAPTNGRQSGNGRYGMSSNGTAASRGETDRTAARGTVREE
jgi:HEAT repeat protein